MTFPTGYWEYKATRSVSPVRIVFRKLVIPWIQFVPSWRLRNVIWRLCGAKLHPTAYIARNALLDEEMLELITVEERAVISYGAMLLAHHHHEGSPTKIRREVSPTKIRRAATIGVGAIILPGVTIGPNALVGAGAVVTEDVQAGTVVAGVPARLVKSERFNGCEEHFEQIRDSGKTVGHESESEKLTNG
jgi:serine acetyltransferase